MFHLLSSSEHTYIVELTDNTDDVNMNTCVCYTTYDSRILPLSVSTAPVSTTAGTNHPPLDTLQLPTSRLRYWFRPCNSII